jgi:hypothetical protein
VKRERSNSHKILQRAHLSVCNALLPRDGQQRLNVRRLSMYGLYTAVLLSDFSLSLPA